MPRTLQTLFDGFAAHRALPAVIRFEADDRPPHRLTYGELEDRALRLAGGLAAGGVRPGDPVGLFAPNSAEWIIARLALIACGALATPFDNDLPPEALRQQLADSGCRRIFTTARHLAALREAAPAEIEPILLDAETETDGAVPWTALFGAPLDPMPAAAPEDPVALFYTSGTTGRPKAVPLTHANILSNLDGILAMGVVRPGDRVLLPLPLHHSYPFIVGMLAPLMSGAAIVLPAGITGPQLARALQEAEVATIVGVPRLYRAIADGLAARVAGRGRLAAAAFEAMLRASIVARERFGIDLGWRLFRPIRAQFAPKLRLLASGGAHLDPEVGRRLEGLGFEVLSGYGLVETASIATFNPRGRNRMGSAGLPAPGVSIRIADPDAEGRGEVQIRGPNVFSGYRNNPEANATAFTADGWFRSGDLGRLDDDGYLFITGRAKEMIVLPGGKNVAPEEVEAVYAESPYVREIVVLERDEALVGLVVPDLEAVAAAGSGRIGDLLRVSFAELGARLPPFKRISGFAVTREELPKTRLGKYRRHLIPPIYERAERGEPPPPVELSPEDRALLERPRARAVWDFLESRFPGRQLSLDTSPQLDLGIDSLAWVGLGMEMESRLGLHLPESALSRVATLRDLLHEAERAGEASGAAAPGDALSGLLSGKERWLAPTGPVETALGRPLLAGVKVFARICFRLRAEGVERVPTEGPLIIAPNHASDLDPFMIGAALTYAHLRNLYWGADAGRAFAHPVLGRLARIVHLFPVDDRAPGASLDMATEVLKRGRILVWFPEQWRSPDGSLQRFLPGIGLLVERTGAPVVPARIIGTFEAMPRTARAPKPGRVSVRFGAPVAAADLLAPGEEPDPHKRVAARVRDAVAALPATH